MMAFARGPAAGSSMKEDSEAPFVAEFRSVSKAFPGVKAVTDVDLGLRSGEVHAICGENGAGKSTLMKLLIQLERPDAGEIRVEGEPVDFRGPRHAQQLGVAMVHQELALVPHLSVADNLFLGREGGWTVLRLREEAEAARGLLDRVGLRLDPRRAVSTLSIAEKQLVEIAKALAVDARITIMDEPTATLTGEEIEGLFRVVERLRAEGIAVVYITHRLAEIFRLADRVTVMRDGRVVTTADVDELDERRLVRHMVGRDLENLYPKPHVSLGPVLLRATAISVPSVLYDCSLEVRAGEIVGLAGIVGAGRSELARSIFGAEPRSSGRVELGGRDITPRSPSEGIGRGLAYVTEDRQDDGLALNLSVAQNITLLDPPGPGPLVSLKLEKEIARHQCRALGIRVDSIQQPVQLLSGGNQQRVMLARWLRLGAHVIFLDEPARGIDIKAKAQVFELAGRMVEEGKGVVLISSYLPELINMCDRIVVMRDGRTVGQVRREDFSEELIVGLATMEEVADAG